MTPLLPHLGPRPTRSRTTRPTKTGATKDPEKMAEEEVQCEDRLEAGEVGEEIGALSWGETLGAVAVDPVDSEEVSEPATSDLPDCHKRNDQPVVTLLLCPKRVGIGVGKKEVTQLNRDNFARFSLGAVIA